MEAVAPVPVERRFTFEFLEPERSPRPVVKLEAASFGYGGHTVLHEVSMALAPGDRVALLGANGAGKSTLMRGMAGTARARAPARWSARRTRRSATSPSTGWISSTPTAPRWSWRGPPRPGCGSRRCATSSGGSGSGPTPATSRVAPLSGGEKTRLALALLILERPNLLLLDEPTNHLDLDMRQALALALQSYSGALVLVSHDRHLLRLVSDSLRLVAGARAAPFEGDLDDYRRWLSERPAAARSRDVAAGSRPSGTAAGCGPGKVSGSSPSGTVATCGPDVMAGVRPSDTVAPGGRDKAARAAGECPPPAGTGSVRWAVPARRAAIRWCDAGGRRGAGPARAP